MDIVLYIFKKDFNIQAGHIHHYFRSLKSLNLTVGCVRIQ